MQVRFKDFNLLIILIHLLFGCGQQAEYAKPYEDKPLPSIKPGTEPDQEIIDPYADDQTPLEYYKESATTDSEDKDSEDKDSEDKDSEDKDSEDKDSEDKDSEDKNNPLPTAERPTSWTDYFSLKYWFEDTKSTPPLEDKQIIPQAAENHHVAKLADITVYTGETEIPEFFLAKRMFTQTNLRGELTHIIITDTDGSAKPAEFTVSDYIGKLGKPGKRAVMYKAMRRSMLELELDKDFRKKSGGSITIFFRPEFYATNFRYEKMRLIKKNGLWTLAHLDNSNELYKELYFTKSSSGITDLDMLPAD